MIRALIDTNVVLDYMLEREQFIESASLVMDAHQAGRFEGFVSTITPLNVFYITRRFRGRDEARLYVQSILQRFEISPADKDVLQKAMQLEMGDYEDAVQAASAMASDLDLIITRDMDGYTNSPVRAVSPAEFISELA